MPSGRGGERREFVVLIACLVASVLLFAFGGRLDVGWVPKAEVFLLWPAEETRRFLEDLSSLRGQNEQLRSEIAHLRQERALLLRAGAENERLRRTLEFAAPRAATLRPARVLGVFGEPWALSYQIEGGIDRGFRVGEAVVAPEGLIGRVTAVGADESTVALLSDPGLAVACEVLPSGARGTVRFKVEERPALYLAHVPLTDTVRVGDVVVTSGASTLFPEGLPVGFVTRLGRDPDGLLQEIEVRPAAPLTRLREVFVVVGTERLRPWQLPPTSEPHAGARADSLRADSLRAAKAAKAKAEAFRP
ncbi:MAG TPA: rod shape-determining protein MreC [Candidatus Eisenbacteria bacterium]|nr:rod shape-determining protein MreC [Candidatus Eisenbacteria bacterium]